MRDVQAVARPIFCGGLAARIQKLGGAAAADDYLSSGDFVYRRWFKLHEQDRDTRTEILEP